MKKRGKVVELGANNTNSAIDEAIKFLHNVTKMRGVIIIAFGEDGGDAFVGFGEVKRKDMAFMGSVLTAEAIGLDTGD